MVSACPAEPVRILLIEDNDGDALLTEEALRTNKLAVNMDRARDGTEALAFLRREPPYADAGRPDLILLDLNMPKMNGREFLQTVKRDEDLCSIPVVVLTTSNADQDVLQSYELQASCYITKPVDFEQFQRIVQELGHFWFTLVRLPPDAQP